MGSIHDLAWRDRDLWRFDRCDYRYLIFIFGQRVITSGELLDIFAPGLIVGQVIGRWGNFMNQEAHGGPVEESFLRDTLHLPNFIVNQMNIEGTFYHPAFLYESLWNLAGLLVLCGFVADRFLRAGELFHQLFHLVFHWPFLH